MRSPLALGLMAIGGARIAATYTELGFTFDEPGHMACGLEYLARHVYRYEPQHPPLARVMTALGPYLDGARPLGIGHRDQEGVAQLYHYGHTGRTLTLMRLGILPFFFLACMVVFWWARHAFGPARGGGRDGPVHTFAARAGARRRGNHGYGARGVRGGGILQSGALGGEPHTGAQRAVRGGHGGGGALEIHRARLSARRGRCWRSCSTWRWSGRDGARWRNNQNAAPRRSRWPWRRGRWGSGPGMASRSRTACRRRNCSKACGPPWPTPWGDTRPTCWAKSAARAGGITSPSCWG